MLSYKEKGYHQEDIIKSLKMLAQWLLNIVKNENSEY